MQGDKLCWHPTLLRLFWFAIMPMYVKETHQCPEEVKASITEAGNIVVKCAKKTFNWVDPDQSQKLLNGTGKKDGGVVCFTSGMLRLSMQQCLEIWLIVLPGLSCKPDVLSSAPTLKDIMKPRSNMELGRRMVESRVIPLPTKWETWSHPKINKTDVVLATHTTDTSWQDDFSWWRFQRCHSNWVSQPRYRHKPFGGLAWGGRYEGVPPVNNQASSNFVVSQDTDVAVLPLVHFDKMKCPKIWIKR